MPETLTPPSEAPEQGQGSTSFEAPEFRADQPAPDPEAKAAAGEDAYKRTMNTINASAESRKIAEEARQEAASMSTAAAEAVKPTIPEVKANIEANPIPGSTIEPANPDKEALMNQAQMNRADKADAKKKPFWKFWG